MKWGNDVWFPVTVAHKNLLEIKEFVEAFRVRWNKMQSSLGVMAMLEDVSILIPYAPDLGPRDAALKWVLKYYERCMPEVEICIGQSSSDLFNRSQAINQAAQQATRNVFVLVDGDTVYDPSLIVESLPLLEQYGWVIPFHWSYDISEESSRVVLQSEPGWPLEVEVKESDCRDFSGAPGGRIAIVTRKNFETVRGMDERFLGWGWEDLALAWSLDTMCGHHIRLDRYIYHLWHSSAGPNPNWDKNHQLFDHYHKAGGNVQAMLQVIKERGSSV